MERLINRQGRAKEITSARTRIVGELSDKSPVAGPEFEGIAHAIIDEASRRKRKKPRAEGQEQDEPENDELDDDADANSKKITGWFKNAVFGMLSANFWNMVLVTNTVFGCLAHVANVLKAAAVIGAPPLQYKKFETIGRNVLQNLTTPGAFSGGPGCRATVDATLATALCLMVAAQVQLRLVWPFRDSLIASKQVSKADRKKLAALWLTNPPRDGDCFSRDVACLLVADLKHMQDTGKLRLSHANIASMQLVSRNWDLALGNTNYIS